MTAIALAGWSGALAGLLVAIRLRRRLELVADAEHELRAPLAAVRLALERQTELDTGPELDRIAVALEDLTAARSGRRAAPRIRQVPLRPWLARVARGRARFRWVGAPATVLMDRRRLQQVVGNLLDNAAEHGGGAVEVRGRRANGTVRIEVADRGASFEHTGRGRGLAIAARAAKDGGGRLDIASSDGQTCATVDLPVSDG